MIVSLQGRWIFFACGKTGTSSIESVLKSYDEGDSLRQQLLRVPSRLTEGRSHKIKHARPRLVKRVLGTDQWDHFFKFVFVRNPWDWVLSQFLAHDRASAKPRQGPFQLTAEDIDWLWDRLSWHNLDGTENYFQHSFVFDEQGRQIVDQVGRFENLQGDFDDICRQVGLPRIVLPRLNSTNRGQDYREYYSDGARELVTQRYALDIELLGYEF